MTAKRAPKNATEQRLTPEPRGCGECLACLRGFKWFLCERPQPVIKPNARDVAMRPWYSDDSSVCLQYQKRRRMLGWQVWHHGQLVYEAGHFDLAWGYVEELLSKGGAR